MFGDVGEGVIGEDGKCYVWLDAVFAQTITQNQYQVFIQKYGSGDCWISNRLPGCFIVEGTPGLPFGWELKAKQRGYDQKRLESARQVYNLQHTDDYGADAAAYVENLTKGRISE